MIKLNKIILCNLTLLFSLNAFSQQTQPLESSEITIDNSGVKSCSVTAEQFEDELIIFRKQQQKELSVIESVDWFLGPPKLDIIMREEKLNQLLNDYKKGKSITQENCQFDLALEKINKYKEQSKASIDAIEFAESRKQAIYSSNKCPTAYNLQCASLVFKVYKNRLN